MQLTLLRPGGGAKGGGGDESPDIQEQLANLTLDAYYSTELGSCKSDDHSSELASRKKDDCFRRMPPYPVSRR